MSSLHLRKFGNRLKTQHTILKNLKKKLQHVLNNDTDEIISLIVPGEIKPIADAKGDDVKFRLNAKLENSCFGWKGIAYCNGARQELIVNIKEDNIKSFNYKNDINIGKILIEQLFMKNGMECLNPEAEENV